MRSILRVQYPLCRGSSVRLTFRTFLSMICMAGCNETPGVERMMTEANRVVRVHHWCALLVFWLTVALVPAAAQVETFGSKVEEKSEAVYMDAMTYAGPN